jgi:hypothetical protein
VTGTGQCDFIKSNAGTGNRIRSAGAIANQWSALSNSGIIGAVANDNAWHSGVAVINGASSVFSLDGVEGTGTITGSTVAGVVQVVGAASTTCDFLEAFFLDAVASTAAQRSYITSGQRAWWGF